jgi:hypothetical protein
MEKISFLTDNSIYIIRYRKKMKKIENKTFGGEEFGVYVMYGRLGRVLFRKACFYQASLQKKRMHGGLYFLYVICV